MPDAEKPYIGSYRGVCPCKYILEVLKMTHLLTDTQMKRLEKKINENQRIRDKVGKKLKIYKSYIDKIEELLPDLKRYSDTKKEIPI